MLGMISERTKKMSLLIAKSLKVLEDTLYRHEEDVGLLEAIVSCLTHLVPLLDQSCEVSDAQQPLYLSWSLIVMTTLYLESVHLMTLYLSVS